MKIDDKILREVLQQKIEQLKKFPKSAQREVENWMFDKYNVQYGVTADIFKGKRPLEIQNYDMLYKLSKSYFDALMNSSKERWMDLDLSGLDVNMYFTETEIKQFEKPIQNTLIDEDIVFDEWFRLNNDQFSTKASIDDIIRWRDLNKVIYNPKTQRDLIIKKINGLVVKKIDINTIAINEMYELMKNNEFFSDDITLNINTDINIKANLLVRIQNGKLILPKEAQIDILDGFHRLTAMCLVKDNIPDWNFTCGIKVVMFDTERANQYMIQQDKKNHLKPKQTKRINKNDEANYIIDRLNRSSRFNLKGTINSDVWTDINNFITEDFNPKKEDRERSIDIYNLIEENINLLVEKKKYFKKIFSKEEWFVYIYLIKKSYEDKIDFMELINNIDIQNLLEKISIQKKPTVKHYKLIDKSINEVKKNAI